MVHQVDLIQGGPERQAHLRLTLNDESQEILDPDTLRISSESVLYCTVKNNQIPARFLRPAYYQIAENIAEDETDGFVLAINNKRYPIKAT